MNWWIVIGGGPTTEKRAVLCEERAINWVREDLKETYPHVQAIPVECHWTAEIWFPVHPHDVDGTGVRW